MGRIQIPPKAVELKLWERHESNLSRSSRLWFKLLDLIDFNWVSSFLEVRKSRTFILSSRFLRILHTVKWYQINFSYTNNFQTDQLDPWIKLTYTTTPGQSKPLNNNNEDVLHTPQSSRNSDSPPNAALYPSHFLGGCRAYSYACDRVNVFSDPPTGPSSKTW